MTTRLLAPTLLAFLTACQPCEGPIVVDLDGMDDTAVVTWAEEGSSDFSACRDAIDPSYADCGPDDDEAEGTFVVRVVWNDMTAEKTVRVQNDNSCTTNEYVMFSVDDFIEATTTGG